MATEMGGFVMGMCVCFGAQLQCTFGLAPATLMVLPTSKVLASSMPVATVMDNKPFVNILPFGMCTSLANPTVAAATAAALGVLTPMPCMPNIVGPWAPGSQAVLVGGTPALSSSATCMCSWGGLVSIAAPGQHTVQMP